MTEARAAYLKTIELEDACLYDFFDLGKIENTLGMHEPAALHLGKAIKISLQMRADQAESFDWGIFRQSSYYLANSFFNLEEYECGILAFTKWHDMHDGSEDIGPFCEAEFLRLAACLYDGSGDKDKAMEVINRAVELDQSSAEIWYDRGVIKRDSGDLDGAIDDFKKAFDLNPTFGMAVHNIGSIYFDRGEQDEACRYWSIGADLGHLNSRTARDQYCSKRHYLASIPRTDLHLKIRRLMNRLNLRVRIAKATAIEFFLPTKLKTDLGSTHEQQGDIEMESENYVDASKIITKAILLKPYDENLYLKRGICWQELEEYDKAIEDFNEALTIRPDFAEALNGMGNIKSFTGDNGTAIEYYTKAISIKPDYAVAIYNRGVSKADLGDHVGAIEDYNKSLEIDPDNGEAYYNRGISKGRATRRSGIFGGL